MSRVAAILDRILPKKVIVNCQRQPYLHRWYLIRRKSFAVFIHRFVRSDEDRALHDHPWSFFVLPVWRGYVEHSDREENCQRCYGIGSVFDYRRHVSAVITCPACNGERKRILPVSRRARPILAARYRPAEYRHRVELLPCDAHPGLESLHPLNCERCNGTKCLPAWSLFIRFTERRVWGFTLPEGWQAWNKWWQEKCE